MIKDKLQRDPDTAVVKWEYHCAKELHTFLPGRSPGGNLFVVDVGTMKRTLLFHSEAVGGQSALSATGRPPAQITAQFKDGYPKIAYKVGFFFFPLLTE